MNSIWLKTKELQSKMYLTQTHWLIGLIKIGSLYGGSWTESKFYPGSSPAWARAREIPPFVAMITKLPLQRGMWLMPIVLKKHHAKYKVNTT